MRFPDEMPTPVGEVCLFCSEPIEAGHWGQMIGAVEANSVSTFQPAHGECLVRNVTGGIEHLTAGPHATGTCYDGSTLTYRQSAVAAYRWLQDHENHAETAV